MYGYCPFSDDKDRMMVGKTIMLSDVRWGGIKGVKSRTFINATLGLYRFFFLLANDILPVLEALVMPFSLF